MFNKLKTAVRLYLDHWTIWLGVGAIYALVYYGFYLLGQLTESLPILTWCLSALQLLVYLYLFIGITQLCVSIVAQAQTSQRNVYVGLKTLFTPFDRLWEPFFLLAALYGLIVLSLQIVLRPEWGLGEIWLEVFLSMCGYLLVLGLLFSFQLALHFNLEADLTITEAYGASAKTVFGNFGSTALVDVVIGMLSFVGYVSQVLLFFLVPLALLLLSVHYFRCTRQLKATSTAIN